MKPVGAAQGKGIFLFTKLSQIADWKSKAGRRPNVGGAPEYHGQKDDSREGAAYVAQKYIENPYLIGGKKFDLRIYVLVTSFAPLTVWLYRDGFARFSNHRFSMRKEDIKNNVVHLTNVAVQKADQKHAAAGGLDMGEQQVELGGEEGSKWGMQQLKLHIAARHGMSAANTMCWYPLKECV